MGAIRDRDYNGTNMSSVIRARTKKSAIMCDCYVVSCVVLVQPCEPRRRFGSHVEESTTAAFYGALFTILNVIILYTTIEICLSHNRDATVWYRGVASIPAHTHCYALDLELSLSFALQLRRSFSNACCVKNV